MKTHERILKFLIEWELSDKPELAKYQNIRNILKTNIEKIYAAAEYLEQLGLLKIYASQDDKKQWSLEIAAAGSSYFYDKKISASDARKQFVEKLVIALISALVGALIGSIVTSLAQKQFSNHETNDKSKKTNYNIIARRIFHC
jgi:hypothetical protein